jgi:glycosyltransferase involved in cell wall biosynthesis
MNPTSKDKSGTPTPPPHPTVDILLATYNGGRFLRAQLDSLLQQDFPDFRLLVRDDGSQDDTRSILDEYSERFGGRMTIAPDSTSSGSACANFIRLLELSNAEYILFCDQDDVWKPEKVRFTVHQLMKLEAKSGSDQPIFWFSDAIPVTSEMKPLGPSFWRSRGINPSVTSDARKTLIASVANGCMAGINRALRNQALPVRPDQIIGHDWYLASLAAYVGRVAWSPDCLMYYRQHGANVSGGSHQKGFFTYLKNKEKIARVRRGLGKRQMQASTILNIHGVQIQPELRLILEDFVAIGDQGPLARRLSLIRGGFLYSDIPRNLGMMMFC